MGIPNFDQAARILKLNLDRSVGGNTYVEFETSVKRIRDPAGRFDHGDLSQRGTEPAGIPGAEDRARSEPPDLQDYGADSHDDSWYADSNGQVTSASGGRRQGSAGIGVPRPLPGSVLDDLGDIQFGVKESVTMSGDGSVRRRTLR